MPAGPNYPSSFTSLGGGAAWSNTTGFNAADASYASATLGIGQFTDLASLTGFGFSLPGGSTVNGITVEVRRYGTNPGAAQDQVVQLSKSGSGSGSNKAATGVDWPVGSPATATYGSSSDLWGTTWSVADIGNIGVLLQALSPSGGVANVDYVRITVDYTAGATQLTSTKTLFVAGSMPASGSAPLYARGHQALSSSLSLFLAGYAPASGGIVLFTGGSSGNQWFSGTTLFERGASPASGQATLFEAGRDSASGWATLRVDGSLPALRGPMPLYLYAGDVPSESSGLSLTLWGSAQSGAFRGADLFTWSDDSGNVSTRGLPLFLMGPDGDRAVRNVNLWVGGRPYDAALGLDLVVANSQSGVDASATLYVSGDGTAAGWGPSEKSLNLFIARNEAAAAALYTQGPGDASASGLPLSVRGVLSPDGSVSLALPGAIGFASKSANLFTTGW